MRKGLTKAEEKFVAMCSLNHKNIRVWRYKGKLRLSRTAKYSSCSRPCCREHFWMCGAAR